jgi:hypothetical protein
LKGGSTCIDSGVGFDELPLVTARAEPSGLRSVGELETEGGTELVSTFQDVTAARAGNRGAAQERTRHQRA